MATVFPTYPASTLAQAEDLIIFTGNQLSDIVNGDSLSEVETVDGFIPTIRKTLVDNFGFKSPIDWAVGSNETVYNQLRKFNDGSWWWAPLATASNPIAMTTDPYTDANWKVFSKDQLTVFENTKRLADEAGYDLIGTFLFGTTINTVSDVVLNEKDGKYYAWGGTLPKVVAAGSSPVPESATEWIDKTDITLRSHVTPYTDLVALTSEYPNNHVGLNSAVSDALLGMREVIADSAMSVNGLLLNKQLTEVSFTGSEQILGPYRKKVVDEFRAPYVPVNTINPDHLKSLRSTSTPTVVIMGDSISTDGPNALVATNTMWSLLKEKLQKDNPSKSFAFHNRAIGGQTWVNANTKPTAFPYWYTDTGADWLTYIESLQPDVLFLAFGMNDSNGFNSGALFTTINKIKAWSKVPDIVFVTNPVPAQTTIFPDGTGFGFVGQTFQEGRDYAAGYARNYANFYGHGVVDINRSMVAMRDCYDVTSGVMHTIETVSASSYIATRAANDFAFTCVVNGASWTEGKVVGVKCGLEDNDFLFIKKTGGNFVFEGFVTGITTYASVASGIAVPAGSFGLEVSVIGGIARLLLDPLTSVENRRVLGEFKVIRHGGIFLPVIGWQGEAGGPFTSIQYSSAFDSYNGDAKYKQTVTDSDVWGVSTLDANTKPIYGGNGINHYSAEGLEFVVRPTIEACDFAVGDTMTGVHAGGRWIKHPDGSAEYSKTVTLTGVNITTTLGAGFIQPDPTVDTDFPAIFMSDGASGYRFEASIHVMSEAGRVIWAASDASSTMNNAIRYRLVSFSSLVSVPVNVQIIMRGRWK